jgi:hypothetical protein
MSYEWRVMIAPEHGIATFLIDTRVVNVALAKLQRVFSVDVSTMQLVSSGYALVSGVATPLVGRATWRSPSASTAMEHLVWDPAPCRFG